VWLHLIGLCPNLQCKTVLPSLISEKQKIFTCTCQGKIYKEESKEIHQFQYIIPLTGGEKRTFLVQKSQIIY
jgi:hypothetical protein